MDWISKLLNYKSYKFDKSVYEYRPANDNDYDLERKIKGDFLIETFSCCGKTNYSISYKKINKLYYIHDIDKDTPAYTDNLRSSQRTMYFNRGMLHRDHDKPALVLLWKNGDNWVKHIEHYYLNGNLHREDGAAWNIYYVRADDEEKYYLSGEESTETEVFNYKIASEWMDKVLADEIDGNF